jgi:hypothetical protein
MSNTFQINKVYSNKKFNQKCGERFTNGSAFRVSLYKENPERCPWPTGRKLSYEQIEKYSSIFSYFVPVRRTKCYLYILERDFTHPSKFKIRQDNDGNECVIIDDITLFASDLVDMTMDEASCLYKSVKKNCVEMSRFIERLCHLEEYGYVYIDNETKVTTIDELRQMTQN